MGSLAFCLLGHTPGGKGHACYRPLQAGWPRSLLPLHTCTCVRESATVEAPSGWGLCSVADRERITILPTLSWGPHLPHLPTPTALPTLQSPPPRGCFRYGNRAECSPRCPGLPAALLSPPLLVMASSDPGPRLLPAASSPAKLLNTLIPGAPLVARTHLEL